MTRVIQWVVGLSGLLGTALFVRYLYQQGTSIGWLILAVWVCTILVVTAVVLAARPDSANTRASAADDPTPASISPPPATIPTPVHPVARSLSELRTYGQDVLSWSLVEGGDFANFTQAMKKWLIQVEARMLDLGCSTAELDEVLKPDRAELQASQPLSDPGQPEWNERRRWMQLHLDKLDALIHRYEQTSHDAGE